MARQNRRDIFDPNEVGFFMLCRGPFVGLGYVAPTGFLTNPSNIGGLGFRIDCGGSFDLLVCVASTKALLGKALILIHEHCYER